MSSMSFWTMLFPQTGRFFRINRLYLVVSKKAISLDSRVEKTLTGKMESRNGKWYKQREKKGELKGIIHCNANKTWDSFKWNKTSFKKLWNKT